MTANPTIERDARKSGAPLIVNVGPKTKRETNLCRMATYEKVLVGTPSHLATG